MTRNRLLPVAAALALLGALGHATDAYAVDAKQTTKEAASSTGGQAGDQPQQQPGLSQLKSDCPSSTTAGVAGGSAQAVQRAGEKPSGPCPPAGTEAKPKP